MTQSTTGPTQGGQHGQQRHFSGAGGAPSDQELMPVCVLRIQVFHLHETRLDLPPGICSTLLSTLGVWIEACPS